MKKFFSMFIAIMCLCTCMVYAEDSKSTEVTFTVGQSFDWTVPADLTLSEGTPKSDTITVTKNVIPQGAKLVIKLSDTNSFELRSTEGATRTYTITKDSEPVNKGGTILEVEAGSTGSKTLSFAVESVSGKKAGTFKGTANFTASVEVPTPSVSVTKGQIVKMSELGLGSVDVLNDGTEDTFRVLFVDGSSVKVLAMDSYSSEYFGSNNTYSGSTLDTKMTEYYGALPANVQSAIVEQNINQSNYSYSSTSSGSESFTSWYKYNFTESDSSGTNYYLTRTTGANVGNRKVYALDVDDVIAYLGSSSTPQDVNELFFNQRSSVSRYVWLRSADAGTASDAFDVDGVDSRVSGGKVRFDNYEVRPAFVLNLG